MTVSMIHIYCGDGKGKTTAAAGLALRMAGHEGKTAFIQFLKGAPSGETNMLEKCGVTVLRCDRDYGFFKSMTETDKLHITECHNKNLIYASENMNSFDMIVLDEVLDACNLELADTETVKRIVKNYRGELVLTGRNPDAWFTERADYISEIRKVKHPYDRGAAAREGIEY